MSLENVIRYINGKTEYGTENFCYLLYSLVKMEQPETVVELGVGAGVSTCMIAQALKENNKGVVWGIDNGIQHQKEMGKKGSYEEWLNKLLKELELEKFINFRNVTLTNKQFFDPQKPIDLLFVDAGNTGASTCVNLLRYYLPKMSPYSSIFIDRSSTIHHAYLMLEQIIEYFKDQKIPACMASGLNDIDIDKIYKLVHTSKFTLVHLTETEKAKKVAHQNSTAWIKIEPLDLFHHNKVRTWEFE